LLICAGDSWTWGDSLSKIKFDNQAGADDFEWRTTHIYGNLIAEQCDRDFINLGLSGYSNLAIIDWVFLKLIPLYETQYKNIIVIFTLTEICREILVDTNWTTQCVGHDSLNEFLEQYEKAMFSTLEYYQNQYPNVTIKVGRNFTYTFNNNLNNTSIFHFDKSWVDILVNKLQRPSYPTNLRLLSSTATEPLITYLKKIDKFTLYKNELANMLADGLDAITWLDESPLNNKLATRHPTEEGHKLWADYLYEECKHIL
jgi:hypothetical protein